MTDTSDLSLSFRSGISLGIDEGMVIAQKGPRPDPEFPESHIMHWTADRGWRTQVIALTAIRMTTVEEAETDLLIMGAGGFIAAMSGERFTEEMVDESNEGPKFRGNIRDMRVIGKHAYAVGMSRQVYRRDGPGSWRHWDAGVVQPLGTLDIAGFSAIDGFSESDLYAAGFEGEIWHFDGDGWRPVDSPTNLIIHRVRTIAPDRVYASGQKGVLLEGRDQAWKPILHDATSEDLWGMEWFNDSLYVSSESGIFRLEDDTLTAVDTGLGDGFSYRHLHAHGGAMWSFGPGHVAKTDGQTWTDVTPT